MTTFVAKDSRLGLEAVRAFKAEQGIDVAQVFLEDQWGVVMIDGRPQVVLNPKGVRALGLLSSTTDGQQVAEDIISGRPGTPGPVT